jgi:hypothetical protein
MPATFVKRAGVTPVRAKVAAKKKRSATPARAAKNEPVGASRR